MTRDYARLRETRRELLLWLPSALPSLAPEALEVAFATVALRELQWETLSLREYAAFEALFRRYHVGKVRKRSFPRSRRISPRSRRILARLVASRRISAHLGASRRTSAP